jgi:hypothetical protein
MAKQSLIRKVLPYAATALAGGGVGALAGYKGGKRVKKKEKAENIRKAVRAGVAYGRAGAKVRERALRAFYVQNRQLGRQNQMLRARLGQMMTQVRKQG